MKKSILLWAVILHFSYNVAQTSSAFQSTNTLPYLLDSITCSAPYLFRSIRGESKKMGSEKGFYYKSLLNVKDAVNAYIHEKTMDADWVADYGEFKTIEEANSKVEELKQQIKNVYPNVEFVEYKGYMAERPDYVLVLKSENTKQYYNVVLRISTVKKAFGVFCIVTGDKGQSNFIEYFPIKTEPGSDQFANDLRMLIQESASGFSNLMGELLSENMHKEYKATKCIDQGKICVVRKYLFGSTFVVSLGGGVSESNLKNTLSQVAKGVADALGKGFSYNIIDDGNGYGFTANDKLSQNHKPIVSVGAEKENESYVILIYVRQAIF